jgi:hypothetical protein
MTSEAIAPALRSRWRSCTSRFVYPGTPLQITLLLILQPPLAVALECAYCLQRRTSGVFPTVNRERPEHQFQFERPGVSHPRTPAVHSPAGGASYFHRRRWSYLSVAYLQGFTYCCVGASIMQVPCRRHQRSIHHRAPAANTHTSSEKPSTRYSSISTWRLRSYSPLDRHTCNDPSGGRWRAGQTPVLRAVTGSRH